MSNLYQQRGVSAQKEDVHEAIKNLDKGLYDDTFCKILPDYVAHHDDYCCIMHADTAGTKSILAYMYWKETGDVSVWKNIAQDAMVMNIDDMICSGATNHFVLSSTIARNKNLIPKEVLREVIQGCDALLKTWKNFGIDIYSAGGETADVGDLVKTIDVGYTAFARLLRNQVVHVQPKPGDVIVGLASYGQSTYETSYNSGIGCNGLTSARHDILQKAYKNKFPESVDPLMDDAVCYIGKYSLTDTGANGMTIGEMLLSPTRTFAPVIKEVLMQAGKQIRGIIHNTGGGQTKCMKYIPNHLHVVKNNLLPVPEIFKLIQLVSQVSAEEMYQVFNMGTRLEIYTDEETARKIISIAASFQIDAQIVGFMESSNKKTLTIHQDEHHIVFDQY